MPASAHDVPTTTAPITPTAADRPATSTVRDDPPAPAAASGARRLLGRAAHAVRAAHAAAVPF
ncbi:hypothetical protein ACVGVM_03240 [Pseudonocardia bannensis]